MSKLKVRDYTNQVNHIKEIVFGTFSSEDAQRVSHVQCYQPNLYDADQKVSQPYGLLDQRMGPSQKHNKCQTCGKKPDDCCGHYGYIDLPKPFFHPGFLNNIVNILQNICKNCSSVLLKSDIKDTLLARAKIDRSYLAKKALYKRVNLLCKKIRYCPHCGAYNGIIKKLPFSRIGYERFRGVKSTKGFVAAYSEMFTMAISERAELSAVLKPQNSEFMLPETVLDLFRNIPTIEVPLLCMNGRASHPSNLILTSVLVPPNCVRPSVNSSLRSGTNEDDLTCILTEILWITDIIRSRKFKDVGKVLEFYEYLQNVLTILNNADATIQPTYNIPKRPKVSYVQRLKGKKGRFRGNLSGKRVNYSARTVISPDPNLRIYEVGIPHEIAKKLTYPETVTAHNITLLRTLVRNGGRMLPGAYSVQPSDPTLPTKSLMIKNREPLVKQLRVGDVVRRYLMDGDIVLFNRQPSLHKLSIMAHRVRILPWKTLRMNECVCAPYNADFDGDEMNIHVPQTEEARAEALVLMGVKSNLVTPRNGSLMIGAIQDFITASFVITQKDNFFNRKDALKIVAWMADSLSRVFLPPATILKPQELWTGKQLFSVTILQIRDETDSRSKILCNLVAQRKDYRGVGREFCANDSYVIIRNSELLAGALDKGCVGSGSKTNVFYSLYKDYGEDHAAEAMFRLARLASMYLMQQGFTIGSSDVSAGTGLLNAKRTLLQVGYKQCDKYIADYKEGNLMSQPGCTKEETLEQKILNELSKIREEAGKASLDELPRLNSPLRMAVSGSKGSFINISQMIACVGQQAINGHRAPDGYEDRCSAYQVVGCKEPASKGFVSNSYFTGLSSREFQPHCMAGREGLVDTAVKTAETGYMQRRLMKTLEDVHVAYDGTVRTSNQHVVQIKYGDDGLDPAQMETTGPVNFDRVFDHTLACPAPTLPYLRSPEEGETLLEGSDLSKLAEHHLQSAPFKELSNEFKKEITDFLDKRGKKIDEERRSVIKEEEEEGSHSKALRYLGRVTLRNLTDFIQTCTKRYLRAVIEPGTAVGALAAQSIGEPSTQMTLKTFHFAGVASMSITLGVPRILEIINASKSISTPVITVKLTNNADAEFARRVKGRIEKTHLVDICEKMEECFSQPIDLDQFSMKDCSGAAFLVIKLDIRRINMLKLEITAYTIRDSLRSARIKIKAEDIFVQSDTLLTIKTPARSKCPCDYIINLKRLLKTAIVHGLPTVNRAIINQVDAPPKSFGVPVVTYELLVEGNNMLDVIATEGVDGTQCVSNNTMEVRNTLGIEAARLVIINEITTTMETHGLSIDPRHVMLLADFMTSSGNVQGINRHGLTNVKESVLVLASFEKTAEHLFDAAYYGESNQITGVSECIITGKPMTIGSGIMKILHKHRKEPLVGRTVKFDVPDGHIKGD